MEDEPGVDRTPCPAWCEGEQCLEPMIEDRRHEGGSLLSVIYRHVIQRSDGTLAIVPDAAELAVVKFTSAVPGVIDETWVALDMSPVGFITITEESMRRVWRVLGTILGTEGTASDQSP